MDDSEASWSSEYSDSLKDNISDAFSEPSTEEKCIITSAKSCVCVIFISHHGRQFNLQNHNYLKNPIARKKMSVSIMGNPITTVSIQGLLTQVCKHNVFVLLSSELQISISSDLDFYASDLKEIMAQDFLKPYIEVKAHDGRLLADKWRNIFLLFKKTVKKFIFQMNGDLRLKGK
ncbi:hypothetical protein PPACK8108_LOCUS1800 [Phakopsora pachyrhizi]|uniref:Uncharacterized protein n=1 Tax=Phakopsora pachyrhizi TaxID=170000 RepID=A0AAV0AKI7_PHAPC|nr:hypothetical protein PPACK8108_LOCUS1800 [Phakopsora pachyrhizi]